MADAVTETQIASETHRTLRADARRNRERILEGAREVFAECGAEAQMDDVASRAGVGVGTVYRHFPTKEALFEAIVYSRFEKLVEAARSFGDAEDAGAALFEYLTLMTREGKAKRDLLEALAGNGMDVQCALGDLSTELRVAIERLLVRAQQAGAVRDDIGVAELMAIMAGAFLALEHGAGGAPSPDLVIEIVYDGLRGRRS